MAGKMDSLATLTESLYNVVSGTHTINSAESTTTDIYATGFNLISTTLNIVTVFVKENVPLNAFNGAFAVANVEMQSTLLLQMKSYRNS
jgi:hypothetical protein